MNEVLKNLKTIRDILYNQQEGIREYHLESDKEFAENYYKDMTNLIEKLNDAIKKLEEKNKNDNHN